MMHVCLQSAVGNESEGWSHLSMSKPSDTETQGLEFPYLVLDMLLSSILSLTSLIFYLWNSNVYSITLHVGSMYFPF